ncbi:Uncharacterised protein [Mycobacteroides abscessus subsp. massiliense]|nr:Uncharacterised protein [Mycobacteroides abscessus subsp. massiliense]
MLIEVVAPGCLTAAQIEHRVVQVAGHTVQEFGIGLVGHLEDFRTGPCHLCE